MSPRGNSIASSPGRRSIPAGQAGDRAFMHVGCNADFHLARGCQAAHPLELVKDTRLALLFILKGIACLRRCELRAGP
jgi:hypothetical protein